MNMISLKMNILEDQEVPTRKNNVIFIQHILYTNKQLIENDDKMYTKMDTTLQMRIFIHFTLIKMRLKWRKNV